MRLRLIITLFLGCFVFVTQAAADSRIRTVTYSENKVISLKGHLGFQTAIEFNQDETIENVAIGDSVSWQVTPNRRGDVLILKPIGQGLLTNMTVVTSSRRYTFILEVADATEAKTRDMVFVLRFKYLDDKPEVEAAPEIAAAEEALAFPDPATVNRNYSYEGASEIIPSQLFDDGRSTYFKWTSRSPTPAIFLVGKKDKESVINHSYMGDYIVVDRVARHFSLRLGDHVTHIYNDGYVPVDPGPDAPQPRPRKRGFFGKVFGSDDEGDG